MSDYTSLFIEKSLEGNPTIQKIVSSLNQNPSEPEIIFSLNGKS
jgi:hypothetical protein